MKRTRKYKKFTAGTNDDFTLPEGTTLGNFDDYQGMFEAPAIIQHLQPVQPNQAQVPGPAYEPNLFCEA